jgi:hypothetical protein
VQVGENRLAIFYSKKTQINRISDSATKNNRKSLQKAIHTALLACMNDDAIQRLNPIVLEYTFQQLHQDHARIPGD